VIVVRFVVMTRFVIAMGSLVMNLTRVCLGVNIVGLGGHSRVLAVAVRGFCDAINTCASAKM
jgi:hypothetical protein